MHAWHGMNHTGNPRWFLDLLNPKKTWFYSLYTLVFKAYTVQKEKKSLIGTRVVYMVYHYKPLWPLRKHLSLGQNLSATSYRCTLQKLKWVNASLSLKSWASVIFHPFYGIILHACFHLIIHLQHNSQKVINYGCWINSANFMHDRYEPSEPENDNKVLSLLLLLLLVLFSLSKLKSLLPLLSLTSLSRNAEGHLAMLIPCWCSRTELHQKNDMMVDGVQQKIFLVTIYHSVCILVLWEKLPMGKFSLSVKKLLSRTKSWSDIS